MALALGAEGLTAGWLAYGAALNEGRAMFPKGDNERFSEWVSKSQLAIWERVSRARAMFPSDEQFGRWLVNCNLQLTGGDAANNRAAAMWAAGNPSQFEEAEAAGNARTVWVTNFDAPTPPLWVLP